MISCEDFDEVYITRNQVCQGKSKVNRFYELSGLFSVRLLIIECNHIKELLDLLVALEKQVVLALARTHQTVSVMCDRSDDFTLPSDYFIELSLGLFLPTHVLRLHVVLPGLHELASILVGVLLNVSFDLLRSWHLRCGLVYDQLLWRWGIVLRVVGE